MYKGTPFALQMARPSRGSHRAKNTLTLKVGAFLGEKYDSR